MFSTSFLKKSAGEMRTLFFVLVASLAAAHAQPDPTSFVSYEEKFLQGVKAYSHKKWKDCIVHMR